jgi:hypothetical protein
MNNQFHIFEISKYRVFSCFAIVGILSLRGMEATTAQQARRRGYFEVLFAGSGTIARFVVTSHRRVFPTPAPFRTAPARLRPSRSNTTSRTSMFGAATLSAVPQVHGLPLSKANRRSRVSAARSTGACFTRHPRRNSQPRSHRVSRDSVRRRRDEAECPRSPRALRVHHFRANKYPPNAVRKALPAITLIFISPHPSSRLPPLTRLPCARHGRRRKVPHWTLRTRRDGPGAFPQLLPRRVVQIPNRVSPHRALNLVS